jgi:hypothetical protein
MVNGCVRVHNLGGLFSSSGSYGIVNPWNLHCSLNSGPKRQKKVLLKAVPDEPSPPFALRDYNQFPCQPPIFSYKLPRIVALLITKLNNGGVKLSTCSLESFSEVCVVG